MADPLSVAGLAFAVVSLGLQVTAGITDYFDALSSRDQDIASARQQNDTLRKTLRVIESSSSRLRLQNDHRPATAALRECLDSCKKELQALEMTVAELVSCDQATTCRKDKIRNQGKKLLYPFNRPKLEQIATNLHNINSNLQLALQTLGLSVSQLGTEKLAALQATSHTISTDILSVQSEVLAMSTPLQGIHSTLSRVETRFDDLENLFKQLLVRNPTVNGTQSETTASMVTGRLLSKPALLQETCDAVGVKAWHSVSGTPPVIHHGTSQFSRTVSMYTGGRFSCLCRRIQQLQRKNAVWGSFSLSLETTIEKHLPGCPATQVIPVRDQRQKVSLTYVGLQSMLNLAIRLSFMVRSGAGGWSLGSNFTYYPLVDSESAPAFRILRLLTRSQCHGNDRFTKDGILDHITWHEKFIPSAVSAILRLFGAKKASPRAVDVYNRSLVYNVAECVSVSVDRFGLLPSQDESSPLLDLLQYLIINKAPANNYDIYGEYVLGIETPLSSMFGSTTYGTASHPLPAASAELLLRSNTEDNVASEAYGCGPLSLAILSNNLEKVELLVRKYPTTLAERNVFGHTPLHLAADKPSCLSIVVKAADTRLLNQADTQDRLGRSAVETAISLSGLNCSENSRMCQGCGCDECAVILLEADCAIPVSDCLAHVLHTASEQCKLTYVRHLKDRRDRLKQLALANLPTAEVERLGLTSERVLDSLASEVTQLLEDGGIAVPAALAVGSSESLPVYQALCSADDAEIFFGAGFRDTDAWNTADTMFRIDKGLPYLHWLTKHGGISWQLSDASARDIYTVHFTFMIIGHDLSNSWPGNFLRFDQIEHTINSESPLSPPFDDRIAWIHELHTAALPADFADACHCQCSPGGCTTLTSILKGLIESWDFEYKPRHSPGDSVAEVRDDSETITTDNTDYPENSVTDYENPLQWLIHGFIIYLEHFWCHLEVRHHIAALRYITYTALGMPHSCCNLHDGCYVSDDDSSIVEDDESGDELEDELEDEKVYDLELLEELLHEFGDELIAILQDPDRGNTDLTNFWKRTWVGRMTEVLDRLEGSDLPDDERRAAEEIGLVWDKFRPKPPEVIGNPHRTTTLDFWMYELEKIEEECQ
ncbi:hypothetical protein G3M48_007755 [Beauveria asiatica]|uniref:Fungal N-terminal domain-containing protein n=1 Tax=Beauveria asiatica TaxID=1069075 RepID=A0AAW0S444_9HYPO